MAKSEPRESPVTPSKEGSKGEETPPDPERRSWWSEETSTSPATKEETTKTTSEAASAFEGEHEGLKDGDTATWRTGLRLTVSDVHRGTNTVTTGKSKSEGAEVVVARLDIDNSDSDKTFTPRPPGAYPCAGVSESGVPLRNPGMAEESRATVNALQTPIEPGQRRTAFVSFALPPAGETMEIRCSAPGSDPLNVPPGSRATWPVGDPSTLPSK